MDYARAIFAAALVTLAGCAATTGEDPATMPGAATEPAPAPYPAAMAEAFTRAEANYARYCSLCHGDDRQGYANDSAPSLRSASLFGTTPLPLVMATAYGRPGTPMGPYLDEMGGPMTLVELRELTQWLMFKAQMPFIPPSEDGLKPVRGDVAAGSALYATNCAGCHGAEGEGGEGAVHGTALGNATMLAVTPDRFLQHAIRNGREGTPMPGWSDVLAEEEIDSIVAFLRSRASGWDADEAALATIPAPSDFVLNPAGSAPDFALREGRYISAEQLSAALGKGRRMVLLDTRVPYFWAMAHIGGSVPVPYYSDFAALVEQLPDDGTWIVAYCECPRAAADHTVDQLRELGFANTAVLWEGYAGWSAQGYPVVVGRVD